MMGLNQWGLKFEHLKHTRRRGLCDSWYSNGCTSTWLSWQSDWHRQTHRKRHTTTWHDSSTHHTIHTKQHQTITCTPWQRRRYASYLLSCRKDGLSLRTYLNAISRCLVIQQWIHKSSHRRSLIWCSSSLIWWNSAIDHQKFRRKKHKWWFKN